MSIATPLIGPAIMDCGHVTVNGPTEPSVNVTTIVMVAVAPMAGAGVAACRADVMPVGGSTLMDYGFQAVVAASFGDIFLSVLFFVWKIFILVPFSEQIRRTRQWAEQGELWADWSGCRCRLF